MAIPSPIAKTRVLLILKVPIFIVVSFVLNSRYFAAGRCIDDLRDIDHAVARLWLFVLARSSGTLPHGKRPIVFACRPALDCHNASTCSADVILLSKRF
jgi:hypothetical protein